MPVLPVASVTVSGRVLPGSVKVCVGFGSADVGAVAEVPLVRELVAVGVVRARAGELTVSGAGPGPGPRVAFATGDRAPLAKSIRYRPESG